MKTTTTNQKAWINCPLCGSPTLLNLWPDKYAGIWECTNDKCGASDSCEHASTHSETVTDYRPSQEQIDRGTDHDETFEVEICDDCGCGTGE